MKGKYLEIGKIVNTHGIRGTVKIIPLTDNVERFYDLKWVYIDRNSENKKLFIEKLSVSKDFVFMNFKGIEDINNASELKNKLIKVDRERAVKLPEDTYFICDIIGCNVYDVNEGLIGKVMDVLQMGSNDVYVIRNQNGSEVLVPALKSVIKEIDIKKENIVIALPKGLVSDEV